VLDGHLGCGDVSTRFRHRDHGKLHSGQDGVQHTPHHDEWQRADTPSILACFTQETPDSQEGEDHES